MMPNEVSTNRDFYRFAAMLAGQHQDGRVGLRDYLGSLLCQLARFEDRSALSPAEFCACLQAAFSVDKAGAPRPQNKDADAGFLSVARQIRRQMSDLADMAADGTLNNELRYFGTAAPSGEYWYNFDPLTYLECAVQGSFGGWIEGMDSPTERAVVDGEVAYLDEDGRIQSGPADELETPEYELGPITWEQVSGFLWCGQEYE